MRCSFFLFGLAILTLSTLAGGIAEERIQAEDTDRRIAKAEDLFEHGQTAQSKQICESLLHSLPDRPSDQLAHTLNVMSKIYASEGDYERAIASAQRSADSYQQIHDSGGQAHALNNKGIAELQTGNYPAAQDDLEKALALSQSGSDEENEVQIRNNLGSAHFFRGSYSEAMHRYEQALFRVTSNASEKWSAYWLQITKFNQATLLQRLGRYDSALKIYREVEASSTKLTGSDRAHLEANLGTLYRRLGDPYKALDAYRAAQTLYASQHDADGEIAVLKNIGIAYALDLEDLPHAAKIFLSAIALAERTHNRREEMQAHLYLGETLFRARDLPRAREEFQRAQNLANELATTEEQWKCLYGLGRIEAANGNLDGAERDYRRAISLIEQTRTQLQLSALRAEFFADKREAYDALLAILIEKKDVSEFFLFLEKSRARNFQDRMQRNQGSAVSSLTLDQAQAHLSPETALLELWAADNQVGILWCTRDKAGLAFRQFNAGQFEPIQKLLQGMPESLQDIASGESSPLDQILPDDWPLPRDIRHLLIVPDAWTSSVPFDLLRPEGSAKPRLIERYDISYLPSAVLLRRAGVKHHLGWPWARELAAFGDPVIAEMSKGQAEETTGASDQNLPHSAKEISDIAHFTRGTARMFLRQEDLKRTFLSSATTRAPLLHVSTHAFADGNNPENSRLLFSPETADSTSVYVFLRELYDLDLTGVDLATISACDTERGKIIRGEGVQAFSRALLSAGAKTSVTTLWRVDDKVTAEFMQQFYYLLLIEKKPKAEALRLAKLKFLHSGSNLDSPAVWAAFVLNGDGLAPTPTWFSWTDLGVTVAGLAALLMVFIALLRLRSRRGGNRQHST